MFPSEVLGEIAVPRFNGPENGHMFFHILDRPAGKIDRTKTQGTALADNALQQYYRLAVI